MMFPNLTRKKSDAICISLGQQTWSDFGFLSPALNSFLECYPAGSPNVLLISQKTVSIGMNCKAVVLMLRDALREAARRRFDKNQIYPQLIICFSAKTKKLNFIQKKNWTITAEIKKQNTPKICI